MENWSFTIKLRPQKRGESFALPPVWSSPHRNGSTRFAPIRGVFNFRFFPARTSAALAVQLGAIESGAICAQCIPNTRSATSPKYITAIVVRCSVVTSK